MSARDSPREAVAVEVRVEIQVPSRQREVRTRRAERRVANQSAQAAELLQKPQKDRAVELVERVAHQWVHALEVGALQVPEPARLLRVVHALPVRVRGRGNAAASASASGAGRKSSITACANGAALVKRAAWRATCPAKSAGSKKKPGPWSSTGRACAGHAGGPERTPPATTES